MKPWKLLKWHFQGSGYCFQYFEGWCRDCGYHFLMLDKYAQKPVLSLITITNIDPLKLQLFDEPFFRAA